MKIFGVALAGGFEPLGFLVIPHVAHHILRIRVVSCMGWTKHWGFTHGFVVERCSGAVTHGFSQ